MNLQHLHQQESQRLLQTRYGVSAALLGSDPVTNSLRLYGEWAEQELDLLSSFVQEGQSIVEFGAEQGAHTLWLARAVGDNGSVHVAEPRRLGLQRLCANLALNGMINVHTDAVWLGQNAGIQNFEQLTGCSDALMGNERVRVTTVDQMELASLHLLKVNLPGVLTALLSGAEETIRRHRPVVYFRLGDGSRAVSEIAALKALGYRCWSHLPYLYNADNYAGNEDNQFPGQVHQNVVAAPMEGRMEFDRLRAL